MAKFSDDRPRTSEIRRRKSNQIIFIKNKRTQKDLNDSGKTEWPAASIATKKLVSVLFGKVAFEDRRNIPSIRSVQATLLVLRWFSEVTVTKFAYRVGRRSRISFC